VCLAQTDLQDTLNSHDPKQNDVNDKQDSILNYQASGSIATPGISTAISVQDRLTKIMERLTNILGRLVNIIQKLAGLQGGSKPVISKPVSTKPPKPSQTQSQTPTPTQTQATTQTAPSAKPGASAGAKGGKALLGWLQQVGLSGEALRTAWAIGMRESGGNPAAHNNNPRTRDNSYGLFQINMIGKMGPARLKSFGLKSYDDLLDPLVNCKAMMKLSGNGRNFGPWGLGPNAYRNSAQLNAAFKKYYDRFPPK